MEDTKGKMFKLDGKLMSYKEYSCQSSVFTETWALSTGGHRGHCFDKGRYQEV